MTTKNNWGEELEDLVNRLRSNSSTDSVHFHHLVRRLLESEKRALVEKLKGAKWRYHADSNVWAEIATGAIRTNGGGGDELAHTHNKTLDTAIAFIQE